jgi:uncharacterized protein (DUF362 family)
MTKSVVSIVKGEQAQPMVEEALSLLGGVDSLIKPASTVVLKPNAGHYYGPETSVNTSPAMVKAIISVVKMARPKKIIVAESSAIGTDTDECLDISGIRRAAEEAGVDDIIDIKRENDLINIPIRDARSDLRRVLLPRFLLEADHIINVPIFKSHVSMVFTCALKNIKGVVQDKVHNAMHRTNLTEAIMDLWSVVRADLNIVDMIRPAEGFGPHSATPVDFGCVVAGKDPVAIDATVCRMVGLNVEDIYYFKTAEKRGTGVYREKSIEVRGKTIEEVYRKFWIPYMGGFAKWPEYHIHSENACSSCLGLLAYSLEGLKALGIYDQNAGLHIVVGAHKELPAGVAPDKIILVGDCTKKFHGKCVTAGGCPPAEPYIMFSILDKKDYFEDGPDTRTRFEETVKKFQEYMSRKREEASEEQKR